MAFIRNGVSYPSQYAYRKSLAEKTGLSRPAYTAHRKSEIAFSKLTPKEREIHRKVTQALSNIEKGQSPTAAAKAAGTSPKTVSKYAEKLIYQVNYITADGTRKTGYVTNKADASLMGKYLSAEGYFRTTGNPANLKEFEGKSVIIDGRKVKLVTDPSIISAAQSRGTNYRQGIQT